jgi:hypothetical protein
MPEQKPIAPKPFPANRTREYHPGSETDPSLPIESPERQPAEARDIFPNRQHSPVPTAPSKSKH